MGAGPLLGCVYFFGWGVLEGQIIIIFVLTVRRIHRFVIWFHFSILKNNSVLNKIHTPYTHLPIIASLKYRHSCVGQDPPTEKWLPALQERRRINFRVKLSLSPTVTHALSFVFFVLTFTHLQLLAGGPALWGCSFVWRAQGSTATSQKSAKWSPWACHGGRTRRWR